ncbi:MAG: signal peptide peptidase SppA [Bacteroides sp.]|nr:signal peptide peptidase SppA [Bacteroides sp.]
MKKFLTSFLGSLAAIWVTITLLVVFGVFMMFVVLAGASQSAKVAVKSKTVLRIDLSGQVTDRPAPADFVGKLTGNSQEKNLPLDRLLATIRHAAKDKNIDGIFLDCNGATAGLAQTQAIINALKEFRSSGKWVYSYADMMTQGNYIIASAVADSLIVNPIAMVDIHGLSSTTLYFKDLLDKVGVDVQVLKVGTYKSAVEPFMLNGMSEANREQQTVYLSSIWNVLADAVAEGRGVAVDSVNYWADNYSYTKPASWLLEKGIVDALNYRHEFFEMMGRATQAEKPAKPRMIDWEEYFVAVDVDSPKKSGKKQIALLYAVGDITEDGDGGIASSRLVPQILDLAENDKVDALVLRVNSGGGSAFASEQIWEALQQFKSLTGKPFFVSMGDMAASGGYYISCGADRIYADKVTLTGSIGIFGIIPCAEKLMSDKLGIHSATVATNSTEQLGFLTPMSPAQREAMQGYINAGYDLFTRRVAEGRGISQDSVKAIAEGRVWDGLTASRIGLVDRLGGLEIALADIAEEIGAGSDEYYVRAYPTIKFKWWEEVLDQMGEIKEVKFETSLGDFAPVYRAVKSLRSLDDPLQCRMEPVIIQ